MSDPLKNASNFVEISGQPGKSLDEQVELLRYAVVELLRHAEEIAAGKPC